MDKNLTSETMDMQNAVDNAANEWKSTGTISAMFAKDLRETKRKVSSTEFWSYVDSLGMSGFRAAVEKICSETES